MSRGCRLSIVGLYNFNNHVFDNMKYPTGFNAVDMDTFIGNVLSECAELELLFPDYDYMRDMVGLWSRLNLPEWNRIYKVSLISYNPIENYNRTEIETIENDNTDTHSGNDSTVKTGTDSQKMNSSGNEANSGTDSSTGQITGYDSENFLNHDKSMLTHGHNIKSDNTANTIGLFDSTETMTHGEKITREGMITRNNHTSGNIGVTTSQQMLTQEVEITQKLNVIKIMCDSFKERFCLLVY